MSESFVQNSGGMSIKGVQVNRVVASGYSISKGSFVRENTDLGTFSSIGTFYSLYDYNFSIVWLDGNRYFFASYKSSAPGFRAGVITVNNDNSFTATGTDLSASYAGYGSMNLVRLSSNKVLGVANCAYNASMHYYILFTISGTSVTMSSRTESIEGYNGTHTKLRYFKNLGVSVGARNYSTSSNSRYRGAKVILFTDNAQTAIYSNDSGFKYSNEPETRCLGVCGNDSTNKAYAIFNNGSSSIKIFEFNVSTSALSLVTTRDVGISTSLNYIVDLGDDTFICFSSADSSATYYHVDASTGTILEQGVKNFGGSIVKVSNQGYNGKPPVMICGDAGTFTLVTFEALKDKEVAIHVGSAQTISTSGYPPIDVAEGQYGTVVVTGKNTSAYACIVNQGVVPALSGESCLGVSTSSGSSGSTVTILIP